MSLGSPKTATYIDLSPVRAVLVDDPKDYRWCSHWAAGNRHRMRWYPIEQEELWQHFLAS